LNVNVLPEGRVGAAMKINHLICMGILLSSGALTGISGTARADSYAATPYLWTKDRTSWQEYKKYNPYLESGRETQNQQWANEDWYVQDWVAQSASDMALIDGFFRADILREQRFTNGVPTLVVGSNFYRLGGFDKRRVITSVDAVYGITERGQNPTILLYDWNTKKQIGLFTKDGLQIE